MDKLKGNEELLKKYFSDTKIPENQTTDYYTFTYALDEYKQRFMKNPIANDNDEIIFNGKTIAGVLNENKKNQEFTGDAELKVKTKTATADLSLNFKDWYEMKYKNLDVGKRNGLVTEAKPELTEKEGIDDNFKFQNKNEIESKLQLNSYGYYKPEETVGTFHLTDGNLSVEGAFGVKEQK